MRSGDPPVLDTDEEAEEEEEEEEVEEEEEEEGTWKEELDVDVVVLSPSVTQGWNEGWALWREVKQYRYESGAASSLSRSIRHLGRLPALPPRPPSAAAPPPPVNEDNGSISTSAIDDDDDDDDDDDEEEMIALLEANAPLLKGSSTSSAS